MTAPRKPSRRPAAAKTGSKPAPAARSSDIPVLEWIAAGIGLVLTLFVLAVIGWEALNADSRPPELEVTRLQISSSSAGHLVQVRVENRGGRPAAQVAIEGELVRPGAPPETAEATLDYVPDHSTREGGLIFSGDPRQGQLTLRAKGYVDP